MTVSTREVTVSPSGNNSPSSSSSSTTMTVNFCARSIVVVLPGAQLRLRAMHYGLFHHTLQQTGIFRPKEQQNDNQNRDTRTRAHRSTNDVLPNVCEVAVALGFAWPHTSALADKTGLG